MSNALQLEITSPAIIHCGIGKSFMIAEEAVRLGRRVVVVTGGHLHGSERIAKLLDHLHRHGLDSTVADPITSEPSVEMVDDLADLLKRSNADVIIAIGGGSVMDTAKAAAVIARNDGPTEDYQLARRKITNPPIAQVFAPTTAGTGSEATRVSVLNNPRVGVKRSISHPWMTPDAVILDPELVASLPVYLTTVTAMDAFAHAIESAVSRNSHAFTRKMALAAIEKLSIGLPKSQIDPNDLNARLDCLMGSCYAGWAMQAGLGASHSLAPAVCVVAGMRHSEAVASLLPHVIRLNERYLPGTYDSVKQVMGTNDLAARIEELCVHGGFQCDLSRFGLKRSDWEKVREVMSRYASHRQTNPVEVTDDYACMLFYAATSD
jgi:alcohol dehydrogenase class IV